MGTLTEEIAITTELDCSADELICFCLARQIERGDVVALGLATPLGAVSALLAKQLYAPDIFIASAIASSITIDPPQLSLVHAEQRWVEAALTGDSFVKGATDYLPTVKPKEFFRPGQVDQHGNTNNIAIGKDYRRPRLRMPGVGGVPDVSVIMSEMMLYVPRHSRVAFPKQLDFISGLGHSENRTDGSGPIYLVSDLGQFDFPNGRMRLTHVHPGVSVDRVVAKTAFELSIADEVGTTRVPTPDELHHLRNAVDPMGMRKLETLSGADRRKALRSIVERDARE